MLNNTPHHPPSIRPLASSDEADLLQALRGDRGFGLFIASNARSYGLQDRDVQFWGQFQDTETGPTWEAVLMVAGRKANLLVLGEADPAPLVAIVAQEPLRFIMGEEKTMTRVAALMPQPIHHTDAHYFADLPHQRFRPFQGMLPPEVTVRRGVPTDVDRLAQLYYGVTGFEGMSYHQVRATMMQRVTHLRTYLATQEGLVVAAASTSAETPAAAMIGGVWTAPDWRGLGLSTAVVSALCHGLRRERCHPYLFYLVDNAPAARVYAKLGFRLIGGWSVMYLDP
jgi:predicted GNAT family acetyltransferase